MDKGAVRAPDPEHKNNIHPQSWRIVTILSLSAAATHTNTRRNIFSLAVHNMRASEATVTIHNTSFAFNVVFSNRLYTVYVL